MRRALIAVLVILALALLAWLVFSSGSPSGLGDGGESLEYVALDGEDAEEGGNRRDRVKPGTEEPGRVRVTRPSGTPYQQKYPEIGQEFEQNPELGSITGRVMIVQTRPAVGAVVTAMRSSKPLARAHAGKDGSFRMANVPPGTGIHVEAHADGFARGGFDRLQVDAGDVTDIGTIYVGAAVGDHVDNRLRVLCKDSEGAPIPDVSVTASTIYYGALLSLGQWEKVPGGTILRAQTDAAGYAEFELMPPAAYDVFAEAEGFATGLRERMTVQHDTKTLVSFRIEAGMTISGRILNEAQEPIAGARIGGLRWSDFSAVPAVVSDGEGKFTLGGLRGGQHMVFANKDEYGGEQSQQVAAGTQDLEIVIKLGGEFSVRVTDAATGQPITKFGLRPYLKVPFAYLFAPLFEIDSPNGEHTMRLPPSDYGLEVSAAGYMLKDVTSIKISPPGAEGDAPAAEPIAIALEAAGIVRGKVVGRFTGKAVIGAEVFVEKGGFPPSRVKDLTTVTDENGVFVLDKLAPRTLSLRVAHVDHTSTLFEGVDPVPAGEDGSLPPPVEFALGSGGRIEGVVLDDARMPQSGTSMELTSGFDLFARRTAVTGDDGRYSFTNVPIDKTYTVSVGRFLPGQTSRSKGSVKVAEGAVVVIDFGTETGGFPLTGRVLRGAEPVANVSISLVSNDGGSALEQERTGDDGTFTFKQVQPGKYQLTAQSGGSRSIAVTVPADQPPEPVEIVMATATIVGTVKDVSTGDALSGVYVECERVVEAGASNLSTISQRWKGNDITGETGEFEIGGLEDGSYRIRAFREGYGAVVEDGITIVGGADAAPVRLELGSPATVTGFVRNAAGTPISGAQLVVTDDQGRALFLVGLTSSSSDGSYIQATLPPGRFTFAFSKDGYAPAEKESEVAVGEQVTLDFTLLKGGTIDVVVTDEGGAPLGGALVDVLDADGNRIERAISISSIFSTQAAKTDARGDCRLDGISPGTYTIGVSKDAASRRSDPFEVVEGGSSRVEIQLPVGSGE